jgi:hypothetical protein
MKTYVVDSLTYAIESGTLRRWECWLLRRIRERLIGEAMNA